MKRILVVAMLVLLTLSLAAGAANVGYVAPAGLVVSKDGSIIVADEGGNRVAAVTDGAITLKAGATDGTAGYIDSRVFTKVRFNKPKDVCEFSGGYVVSDSGNHCLRFIGGDKVYTFAGSGNASYTNGAAAKAGFNLPWGLASDGKLLYVADCGNNCIRTVDKNGRVGSYAGSIEGNAGYADGALDSALFDSPTGICLYDGALYVCDSGNQRIRMIKDGKVSTVAGAPLMYEDEQRYATDYTDAPLSAARFANPMDIAAVEGVLYVADSGNGAVRRIAGGEVSTLALPEGTAALSKPSGITVYDGKIYVSDAENGTVTVLTDTDSVYNGGAEGFARRRMLFDDDFTYGEDKTVTRGEFVAAIGRMYNYVYKNEILYGEEDFLDVEEDDEYSVYIGWAAQAGIALGISSEQFAPLQELSRNQLAVLLYRTCSMFEEYTPIKQTADIPDQLEWAHEAAQWAVSSGLVSGQAYDGDASVTAIEAAEALEGLWNLVFA